MRKFTRNKSLGYFFAPHFYFCNEFFALWETPVSVLKKENLFFSDRDFDDIEFDADSFVDTVGKILGERKMLRNWRPALDFEDFPGVLGNK